VNVIYPAPSTLSSEIALPGNTQAYVDTPIYARTSGYLKSWRTDIGARVHKGELLAEIETPEVDKELAQARADLATAQANLAISEITNERWQGLLKKQAVSKQDADNRAADAAAKKTTVDSAEQNVKRLQDLEAFKRVVAPFDGVVTARNTDVGYLINAGQAPGSELFRLADIHRLRIYAQVPEAYAGVTSTGLKAELHFAERPGVTYATDAVRTSNALDPTARTLQVELQLDNREAQLFPGSYTDIHFKLPSSTQTLRLPSNTVLFRGKNLQVAVVERDQTIKLKDIDQGRDFGKTIEVLHGIGPDDDVVVNPPDSIEDGMKVRIAPPPSDQGNGAQPAP
jgi:RND family efflux transporter MFP subunit